MASSYTTNKDIEKPGNGDYVDTWNVPLNGDMTVVDYALGTTQTFNATAGSQTLGSYDHTTKALVTYSYVPLVINITGAMSANVVYTIPAGVGGQWSIRNITTDASGGPWTVTFASGGGGSSIVVERNVATIINSDGTNIFLANNIPPANNTVTNAKLSQVATQTVKGRNTAGTGNVEDITISQILDWVSSTQGSILYRGASNWAALAPGTSGQVLQTQGAGANPIWATLAGGFSNMQVFTSSGTFTVPAGITKIKVYVTAGGGGGGAGAGGGGAGGTAIKIISGLTPGASIAVTVGTGGSAFSAGNASSFGAYCSASAGQPTSSGLSGYNGGAGGVGSGGDLNLTGGGGGPGGLGGSNGIYGPGGSSYWGAGAPGSFGAGAFNAGNYGGGGGGGGGSGSDGVVVVEY